MTDTYKAMHISLDIVQESIAKDEGARLEGALLYAKIYALASIADSLHELTSALDILPRLNHQAENALGAIESAADHISRRHG